MKKNFSLLLTFTLLLAWAGVGSLRAENIGVPSECEDVMLQGFYWDSYKTQTDTDSKYGRTKWIDLLKDTVSLTENFDLIWFPPSARSTGGVGYYHTCLSDQGNSTSTPWGSKEKLLELIDALHRGGTKVIADVVINHRGSVDGWCGFAEDKFGEGYGSFQLTSEHICKGDEAFTNKDSNCYGSSERGAADTGTNDGGARDLDHTNEYVQNWAMTYERWLMEKMRYDGFRYDMTLGYHGRYLSMYNQSSQPYLSVSELWEGIDRQKQHLVEAEYNTMIFDFQQKYVLHNAIVKGNYSLLKKNSNSFRGQGLERYAVTFVDNHDTFERDGYGNNQFGGQYCDLSKATIKAYVLQAYAYILSMPGVPCVFYPHWSRYKDEIQTMIAIRKQAGIHSESQVLEEESGPYAYSGTIQGHHRKLIVRVGKNRDMTIPDGYWKCIDGDYYTMYLEVGEGMEEVESQESKVESKFIKNGQLCIRVGEHVYDARGIMVE